MSIESKFTPDRLKELRRVFDEFDANSDGSISLPELKQMLQRLNVRASDEEVDRLMREGDMNQDSTLDYKEFLTVVHHAESGSGSSLGAVIKEVKKMVITSATGGQHSYTEEEKHSFVDHINSALAHDDDIAPMLPIDRNSEQLFEVCSSGLLLAKLINHSVNGTIDERVLVKNPRNIYEKLQNLNLAVNSAKAIGCSVVNIGAQDIIEGRAHLILGLIWQVIKIGLLQDINLQAHPELVRLLNEGEEMADLLRLPPEQLLLRWVNYHLREAGSARRIANFGADITDSEAYTILLKQISRGACDDRALGESDRHRRAELVLDNADRIGCRKFVSPNDIVKGNQKLNLAFVANLFNTHPALEQITEAELAKYAELMEFDQEGTREERAFRFWLNNLGIEVSNLFDDFADGVKLLKAFDIIAPGSVDWRRVSQNPRTVFQKGENCNYAVDVGKGLKFSLVGIGGTDIVQKNKKLVLALVWQMMRHHIVGTIKKLSAGGKDVTDAEIVAWANRKVAASGKSTTIANFRDQSISTGRFLLDLCNATVPGIVNYDIVTPGDTPEGKEMNAKYAISVARAMGVTLFALWEDIVDVNPKMVLTFVGGVMLFEKMGAAQVVTGESSGVSGH